MSASAFRPVIVHSNSVTAPEVASTSLPYCLYCNATDEFLIAEIQSGGHQALDHLFDRYYELVFRVSRRILRDPGEAQDLTQEVFLQIFRKIHRYDRRRGSARTWLMAITCYRSLDRRRYLASRKFYAQVGVERLESSGKTSPQNPYQAPSLTMEARLDDALGRLTARQRQTIELYCFAGLTLREIAVELGESFSNTRHLYYRGIENLQIYLKGQRLVDGRGPIRGGVKERY